MFGCDMIRECFVVDVASGNKEANRICLNLIGSTADTLDKGEIGTRLEMIGYVVNLETIVLIRLLTIKSKSK